MNFPNLQKVYGQLIAEGEAVEVFNFPLCTEAQEIEVSSDAEALVIANLPVLEKCVNLRLDLAGAIFEAPLSMTAGGLQDTNSPSRNTVALNNINTVNVYGEICQFRFTNSANITTITSLVSAINGGNCENSIVANFEGCALTTTAINTLLSLFDNGDITNAEFILNNGTNAPLDATGLTLKSSLESKGCTVTVNV